MSPQQTTHTLTDWLRLRLQMRPHCDWVCDRLGEYYTWDLKPAEFEAIEKHLHACPACAKEWRKTERLLSELETATPIAEELNGFSSDRFVAGAMARIAEYETAESVKVHYRWHWMHGDARRFAAVLVLLVSTVAMAYVSFAVRGHKYESGNQKDSQDKTTMQVVQPEADRSDWSLSIPSMRIEVNLDLGLNSFILDSDLNRQIDDAIAKAQFEAMLPHTEAEWEVWARKEFPHIMWVYDVLTKPEYGISWDGKPAYTPEWAKKIWTDEATEPTGWRALVFYSGEILKFDYPIKPGDPNVNPTIQAMKFAAAIAGYDLRLDGVGKNEMPRLEYADLTTINETQTILLASLEKKTNHIITNPYGPNSGPGDAWIMDYADRIVNDHSKLAQTLINIAVRSHCIPSTHFKHLESTSNGIIGQIENVTCSTDETLVNLRSLMLEHARLLNLIKSTM